MLIAIEEVAYELTIDTKIGDFDWLWKRRQFEAPITPNVCRSSAELRPNSLTLPSRTEPNIRPNSSAELRRLPNFGPSLSDMPSTGPTFGYPSCVYPPTEGFPWDDLRMRGGQPTTRIQNCIETLPKISSGWEGRTKVTDDRQTDRRICHSKYPNVTYCHVLVKIEFSASYIRISQLPYDSIS